MILPSKFSYVLYTKIGNLTDDQLAELFVHLDRHNDIKTIRVINAKLSSDCASIYNRYFDKGSSVPGISNINQSIVKMILYARTHRFSDNVDDKNEELIEKLTSEIAELKTIINSNSDDELKTILRNKQMVLDKLNTKTAVLNSKQIEAIAYAVYNKLISYEERAHILNSFEYRRSRTRPHKIIKINHSHNGKKNYRNDRGNTRDNNKNNDRYSSGKHVRNTRNDGSKAYKISETDGAKVYENVKPMWTPRKSDDDNQSTTATNGSVDKSNVYSVRRNARNTKYSRNNKQNKYVKYDKQIKQDNPTTTETKKNTYVPVRRRRGRNNDNNNVKDKRTDDGFVTIDKLSSKVNVTSNIEFPTLNKQTSIVNAGNVASTKIEKNTIDTKNASDTKSKSNNVKSKNMFDALLMWDDEEEDVCKDDKVGNRFVDLFDEEEETDVDTTIKTFRVAYDNIRDDNVGTIKSSFTIFDSTDDWCDNLPDIPCTHAKVDGSVTVRGKTSYITSYYEFEEEQTFDPNNTIEINDWSEYDYDEYDEY
jgi:hypothetical protein